MRTKAAPDLPLGAVRARMRRQIVQPRPCSPDQ